MKQSLLINGFPVEAEYTDAEISGVFEPLLRRMAARQKSKGRRVIVFLAAPPATGKSTLAAFLQQLSENLPGMPPMQTAGLDGFHFRNAYLAAHTTLREGHEITLKSIKGAPETFDVIELSRRLNALRTRPVPWPFYDRRLHEPVENGLLLSAPIILLEGNYLLLDAPLWRDLAADLTVFVSAPEALLRSRLIARKNRGGLPLPQSEQWYEAVDGPNVRLCLAHSRPADLTLALGADGYSIQEGSL